MLDTERQYFEDHQPELLKEYPGKFVIIRDQEIAGSFDTLQDALVAGTRQFGLSSFLIRRTDELPQEVSIPSLALGILHAKPNLSTIGPGSDS